MPTPTSSTPLTWGLIQDELKKHPVHLPTQKQLRVRRRLKDLVEKERASQSGDAQLNEKQQFQVAQILIFNDINFPILDEVPFATISRTFLGARLLSLSTLYVYKTGLMNWLRGELLLNQPNFAVVMHAENSIAAANILLYLDRADLLNDESRKLISSYSIMI
jgi:hypothetical protein